MERRPQSRRRHRQSRSRTRHARLRRAHDPPQIRTRLVNIGGASMKWCRVEMQAGPSYGIVRDSSIELVEGSPFETWRKSGQSMPLESAKLLVPVIPPVFYAIGSNY